MPAGPRGRPSPAARAACRTLLVLALVAGARPGACQDFQYVDPALAACPAPPAPGTASPRAVRAGVPQPGSITVACGFDAGSYTVTLESTDPAATFTPKTFLVNFGRVAGRGRFTVTFATAGVQSVSASITSNMGSPPVRGRFASAASEFLVGER
jgi:hypothetical protein